MPNMLVLFALAAISFAICNCGNIESNQVVFPEDKARLIGIDFNKFSGLFGGDRGFYPSKPKSSTRGNGMLYISITGPDGLPPPLDDTQVLGIIVPTEDDYESDTDVPITANPAAVDNKSNVFQKESVPDIPQKPLKDGVSGVPYNKHSPSKEASFEEDSFDELMVPSQSKAKLAASSGSAYPRWSYGPVPIPAIRGKIPSRSD